MRQISPFDDARLLYERAAGHIEEFNLTFGRKSAAPAWRVSLDADPTGGCECKLILNREALRKLKPIAADIANNLIHALDHVVAASARIMNPGRHRDLYFPFATDDLKFYKKTSDMARKIGNKEAAFLEGVRKSNPHVFLELQILKEVSNSVKIGGLFQQKTLRLQFPLSESEDPRRYFRYQRDISMTTMNL